MAGKELKASERIILKKTKEGVVEKNLVTGKTKRVSKRTEEAVMKNEVMHAKLKVAGLEKPTESKRQFKKLQYRKNNPENHQNEDESDNQHSEQTLSLAMPVVSINFDSKNEASEFSTKEIKKQRKERQKQDRQLEKNENTEDYVENPEDSPDIEISEEPKIKDNKTRNTIEDHLSVTDNLKEESEDSQLVFEDGANDIVSDSHEAKPRIIKKDVADSDIPDTIAESKDNASDLKPSADKKFEKIVSKDEKKLSKIEKKLEKAEKKLPKERVVTFEKKLDPKKGKYKRKLRFETEVKPSDREYFFSKPVKNAKSVVKNEVSSLIHGKISEYEEDNSALKAAHSTEKVGESAFHTAKSAIKMANQSQLKAPYKNVSKLKFKKEQTEKKLSYHKALSEKPEMCSGNSKNAIKEAMKNSQQKQHQKKAAKETKKAAEKAKEIAENIGRKIVEAVASSKWAIIVVVIFLMVFCIFGTLCTSCCSSLVNNGTAFIATSYTAKEEDIYAANNHMINLENSLSDYLNHIPDYYIGWNEYNYHLDGIGHDPYKLISYLSAMKIAFKYDYDTQNMIDQIYNELYKVDIVSTDEVRSYTYTETDINGNLVEVTVYYDYYILDVTLSAKDFDSIVRPKLESAGVYDLYVVMLENKGNKPYLF